MLVAALVLLLLGLPLQLCYAARLIITKGNASKRWYWAAMAGGLCNVASGILVRDPLLITGQASIMCIYALTRPRASRSFLPRERRDEAPSPPKGSLGSHPSEKPCAEDETKSR